MPKVTGIRCFDPQFVIIDCLRENLDFSQTKNVTGWKRPNLPPPSPQFFNIQQRCRRFPVNVSIFLKMLRLITIGVSLKNFCEGRLGMILTLSSTTRQIQQNCHLNIRSALCSTRVLKTCQPSKTRFTAVEDMLVEELSNRQNSFCLANQSPSSRGATPPPGSCQCRPCA